MEDNTCINNGFWLCVATEQWHRKEKGIGQSSGFFSIPLFMRIRGTSSLAGLQYFYNVSPAYEILRSLLRSSGGDQEDHIACIAGKVTP